MCVTMVTSPFNVVFAVSSADSIIGPRGNFYTGTRAVVVWCNSINLTETDDTHKLELDLFTIILLLILMD